MPKGSIASLLQEASKETSHVLDRPMRHRIALGIAGGISFLHTQCNPPIVHGDVKPNNVLLDADWEPHLSDFGLTALTRTAVDPTPSSSSVGSLGYVSPEANESGELIQEADVYSFGRVLLQLRTGRRPAVFNVQDEDIAKWGKRMLQLGEITKVFDSPFRRKNWQVRSRHHGPMTSNFQKIKGSIFSHNCRSEKTKELVKEPSPQSLGSFSSSSMKEVRLFENFQKPKIGIYLEFF
jgi:serine/threonine protein kinase